MDEQFRDTESAGSGGFWQAGDPEPISCNPGDLATPFGVLDLDDICDFLAGFLSQIPLSDLAPPFGVYDPSDINVFIGAFVAGCP